MSKKQKTRLKIMPCPGLSSVHIITMLAFICMFPLCATGGNTSSIQGVPYWIIVSVFCFVPPIVLFLVGARRFFCIVKIDENGISRSFLGKFYKLSMTWDEIAEIAYFESLFPFIMFSKTKSIQGMTYNKITTIKDLIQISLTPKRYEVIKLYIKQPIVGLTDDIIKKWKF